MEGLFFQKDGMDLPHINQNDNHLNFLAGCDSTEIMVQTINPDCLTYIKPNDDSRLMEFFYVLNDEITLIYENRHQVVRSGESFYIMDLKQEVLIKCDKIIRLLYVTNNPMFNSICSYRGDLKELLHQTDLKDSYAYGHGKRVMEYSVKLAGAFNLTNSAVENLTIAALYHDIGKCYTPIEILNKKGKLTQEEYRSIMKHPVHTRILLEKHYNERIAEIAEQHHERLNGCGYPYGLSESEICLEGRIIAVADTFDAMTTDRPYKLGKSFDDAFIELNELVEKGLYDGRVVNALEKLFKSKEL